MPFNHGSYYTEDGYWSFVDRVQHLISVNPNWFELSVQDKRYVYYMAYEENRDDFNRHYKRAMKGDLL